jgi:MoxR-like ATPase
MAERQITVGSVTYPLPNLFLVMATQNPIEQEGTYPLPEAQLDRFLLHVKIDYPKAEVEKQILALSRQESFQQVEQHLKGPAHQEETIDIGAKPDALVSQEILFNARKEVLDVFMATNLEQYLLELILTTRDPTAYGDDLRLWMQYGASPRASIALDRCARAHAWLAGRDYVDPEDIQTMAYDVLRHRIILTYEAEADGITPDGFIKELLSRVPVP